jgi:phosphomannomutase/phosphoglucomutase
MLFARRRAEPQSGRGDHLRREVHRPPAGQILRHGGSPMMWKTGHSLIKAKMKETEAELAGEMSGHFFFRERWFGFDDGIYSARAPARDHRRGRSRCARDLRRDSQGREHAGTQGPDDRRRTLRVHREVPAASRFEGAKIATIDGVRADWPDGWGLVRCSNTTPSLVLRFDADNAEALVRIQDLFRSQLLALDPSLELPF